MTADPQAQPSVPEPGAVTDGPQVLPRSDDNARFPVHRTARSSERPQWLRPRAGTEGLQRYRETIRERLPLIVLCVALTTAAAIGYLGVADKVYQAEADLLVTPVSSDSPAYVGLGLIRNTNDPTRDVLTAARLVSMPSVARLVVAELGLTVRPSKLLRQVDAAPVTQSNIVAVQVKASSAEQARALADSFARQTVVERTDALHRQLDLLLPELQKQVSAQPDDQRSGPGSLGDRFLSMQTLRAGPDPTIQLLAPAELPDRPLSPRPKLTVAAGLLAGVILGLSAAFGLRTLDQSLRREDQLRDLFDLPLLARVPLMKGRLRSSPIEPGGLSAAGQEAFRSLRTSLMASTDEASPATRVVFVAGSTASEGKTTTAINLAASLAETGASVILIEADLRRPTVGATLHILGLHGLEEVLAGAVALRDALVPDPALGLQLLLASGSTTQLANRLSTPAAHRLISEARALADYVLIDAPPLTEVIDALPLAFLADDILIVARLRKSKLSKLADLGELLLSYGLRPMGTVVLGGQQASSHYYVGPPQRRAGARPRRRPPAPP